MENIKYEHYVDGSWINVNKKDFDPQKIHSRICVYTDGFDFEKHLTILFNK